MNELRWNRGRLSLHTQSCSIDCWELTLEHDRRCISSTEVGAAGIEFGRGTNSPHTESVELRSESIVWHIDITLFDGDTPRVMIDTDITNTSDRPVALGKVRLLSSPGGFDFGPGDHETYCLPMLGDLTPRRVYRLGDPECTTESRIKTQFIAVRAGSHHEPETPRRFASVLAGFDTFKRCNTIVRYKTEAGDRIEEIEAYCDFGGWELKPGDTTRTETFSLSVSHDPYAQLEQWAIRAAAASDARRWEEPPIGWLGWAWVDPFTVEKYEDIVHRNAEAIERRLGGFGLRYVWISIGNLKGGVPGRWNDWNDDLFPSGHEHLRRYLEQRGLRLGLWCGPFWMCETAGEQIKRLEKCILPDETGAPMVAHPAWPFGDAGHLPKEQRPRIFALDPSHPEVQRFLEESFETYRSWGVRYYMIDFLNAGAGNISNYVYATHHDGNLVPGPEVYHSGLSCIRRAAGDDTYLLTSSGPSVHNTGFADGIRTGNDFGEGRALYPDSYFYPATFVINNSGFWTGAQRALQNQATMYYTHRRLFLNDSGNVLTVDKPIPRSDARIHATIHVMSGGPSMIGDDLDRIDDERLSFIKATLPRPRDVARPLDLYSSVYPDCPHVFHRTVIRPWGRFDVIALYNFTGEMSRTVIDFPTLGLAEGQACSVWEFWNSEYLGTFENTCALQVPPRDVRVFRFTDASQPALIGTDMHILMGEVEVLDLGWDEDNRTLSGTVFRPAGESGNVFIRCASDLRIAEPEGLWIAKDARDESLIIGKRFRFTGEAVDFRVAFTPLKGSTEPAQGSRGDW